MFDVVKVVSAACLISESGNILLEKLYSGTSDSGHSEKGTLSVSRFS